jgi:hypothetical protein
MKLHQHIFIHHKTDEIPYTYKSTGKIIVPYISNYSFFESQTGKK